ncbi:DUF6160 family protein [Marinobacteraceae bacterium S3BR75-40.1]
MKGLKKIALVTAIAGASFGAQAELKAMNDSAMGDVTGQAGVTIELDANVSIGEIQYKDQGSLFMKGVTIGGLGQLGMTDGDGNAYGTSLDNLKIDIDIAGSAGGDLGQAYGLDKITDTRITTVANTGTHGEVRPTIEDGDLVIALDAIDQNDGVDMYLGVQEVSLGTSSEGVDPATGSYTPTSGTGTVLLSNLNMAAQLGPIDIVIDGQTNNMNINAYFQAGGQVTMPFMATSMGFKVHNSRGSDVLVYTNGKATPDVASFAHAQVDISPNTDTTKGLNVNVTDFSGDIDLTNITLGSAPAIGHVFMTDLSVQANMNVYGH